MAIPIDSQILCFGDLISLENVSISDEYLISEGFMNRKIELQSKNDPSILANFH